MLRLRRRHERPAYVLYCRAVAAARERWFYVELGVPDTLDGRFDMVGVYVFLVIRRLQALPAPGPALAQAVFDAMFNDMDLTLREMGVGDLGVGRHVKAMWEGFHGRAQAYQAALEAGDMAALAEALARNVWRDPAALAQAARLAEIVRLQDRHLSGLDQAVFARGDISFRDLGLLAA